MDPFLRSKSGKLFVGGCGLQLGLLFSFTGLVATLLVCAVCGVFNLLTFGLTGTAAEPTVAAVSEAAPAPEEVELLRQEMEFLLARVNYLRENPPVIPIPTATPVPPPPKPVAVASQSGVNLRSGPAINHPRIGRLPLGGSLEIVGRNGDSSWWLVATPGGGVAWLSDMAVAAANVSEAIPVVSIPALYVEPGSIIPSALSPSFPTTLPSTGQPTPTPAFLLPPGTPTPAAQLARRFVQDTMGYKQLIRRLMLPTVSESFSPQGSLIAITERVKLYTIPPDGTTSRVLLEDDDTIDLVGGAIWSPDGRYLAFVANQIVDCDPCRRVGLVRMSDGAISYLQSPPDAGLDLPRWTQDGRLLVTAYSEEPVWRRVYIYDISGQGQVAEGVYVLSSSHDGQKWFPWQPGKTWQVDNPLGADSYYRD
jgi:hypothetical protein